MASHLPHILSTRVLQPAPLPVRPTPSEFVFRRGPDPDDVGQDEAATVGARRTRIWEFDPSLHCSIVGTCLSTGELRHILCKLKIPDAATDHELHSRGVVLAGRRDAGAKFLQKALDRRHQAAITRYSRAKDAAGLLALWEESLKQGDIPGAYWAVLTHSVTGQDIVKRVFGDVHMLSHLVGAANRADIRRLRQLEQDNAALAAKVERQQRALQDGFKARDATIRRLGEMLARQPSGAPESCDANADSDDAPASDTLIRDLNNRLARETAHRERTDRRLVELTAALKEKELVLQASRRQCQAALRELHVVEEHLGAVMQPDGKALAETIHLSGLAILYVGGRAHQVPQLKGLVERLGARCLHHDGGIEHGAALLPGLVSRADCVLFPIDCVSHDAMTTLKKLCRQIGKPYVPLRTASLACLLSALARTYGPTGQVAAE
jgi:uncharacterized protein DUF2325